MVHSNNKTGPIILAIGKVLFGTTALFIKVVPTPIILLLIAQSAFGAIGFLPKVWSQLRTLPRSVWWLTIVVSGSFLLNDFSFYFAVRMIDVSLATLVRWIAPILLASIIFITAQSKDRRAVIAAILGFVGLFLVLNSKGIEYTTANLQGVSLAALSAVAVTTYWYSAKILLQKISATVVLWLRSITALPILLLIAWVGFKHDLQINFDTIIAMGVFGTLYGIVAGYLDTVGIQRTQTQYLGIIGYLVPLTTLVGAVVVLHEAFTPIMVLGGLLILGSGYWAQRPRSLS